MVVRFFATNPYNITLEMRYSVVAEERIPEDIQMSNSGTLQILCDGTVEVGSSVKHNLQPFQSHQQSGVGKPAVVSSHPSTQGSG